MKGDRKRKQLVKEIGEWCNEFLGYPNQCAYTDSIVDMIIKKTYELEQISN